MSSFNYVNPLPISSNNPSVDQPNMNINTQSASDIWDIDHIGFNANNGGTHLQVTFSNNPGYIPTPTTPTANEAVLYTSAGVASADASLKFVNSNATFVINPVRAWALASAGGITSGQSFNVTSVTRTGVGTYNVVLPANVVTGTNYGVIGSCQSGGNNGFWFTYNITSATTFSILVLSQGGAEPTSFNFQVIQV